MASDSLDEWKNYLDSYKISYPTYSEFLISKGYEDEADDDEPYYVNQYSEKLSEIVIEEASEHVVNETFSILFRDRKLLMEFNKLLADQIIELKQADYPVLLAKDGIIKRCTYWPDWVKRALIFRDQGSCAICLSDISGLIKVEFEKAIDHIVPLKLGGTNDITNLQLLCRRCNLEKLDHTIKTSDYYSGYF
ncbi:HNH endonuclease [Sphingobacterium bovistauri]|uniref:HNH endonuclease n=1 Tax=Sphingobacterium bovistauri TaxID=2781959 RepID=A0ABS7Z651_9SPHI|nr:HNH endonuclease signature motif containing protein [Sphingobacterium bovistauri]MCA5005670.1 HNH endonuclease [Sphingobacterium bovistauri]